MSDASILSDENYSPMNNKEPANSNEQRADVYGDEILDETSGYFVRRTAEHDDYENISLPPLDEDEPFYVEPSSSSQAYSKKHFCIYCKKLITKIARHYENVHKLETDVKKFTCLPPGKYYFKFFPPN